MKVILKNTSLTFASATTPEEVSLTLQNGVYNPTSGETINFKLSLTTNPDWQSSQIVEIDRTKYSKIKIISEGNYNIFAVFAGENYSIMRKSISTNTEYDLTSTKIDNNPIDGWMNYYHTGETCHQISLSASVASGTSPYIPAATLAAIKIQLLP